MKKIFHLLLFLSINIFANSNLDIIKNLIGENKFNIYKNLITSSIENNSSLSQIINFLENNGLLNLTSTSNIIKPIFIFQNPSNPIFNTKILYDSLYTLGYINLYPTQITKQDSYYQIQLKIKAHNYIDPLNLINTLNKYNCKINNIIKKENFIYYIDCKKAIIPALPIQNTSQTITHINGIYWLKIVDNFKNIKISTSKYDFFHPYIVFYDENLHILNIITFTNVKRKLILPIPQNTKYIKIKDYFTKENIKRGIFIKGLK